VFYVPNQNKNEDEKIEELLQELKDDSDVSYEDLDKLRSMLKNSSLDLKKSKLFRVKLAIKRFILSSLLLYIISMLTFGFLFSWIKLENIFWLFGASGIVSMALAFFEVLPSIIKNKHPLFYISSFLILVVIFCITNDLFMIFDRGIMWAIHLIIVEVAYAVIIFCIYRRKYNFKGV